MLTEIQDESTAWVDEKVNERLQTLGEFDPDETEEEDLGAKEMLR